MELIEILTSCKRLAQFLSSYSLGRVKDESDKLIRKIDKYIEEEKLYKD
jgi:hypothetical protein